MKRRLKTWEALAIQVVFITAVMFMATSCEMPNPDLEVPPRVELIDSTVTILGRLPYQEVVRIEDKERGVVCYAYRDFESTALDCMPSLQLSY